MKKVLKYLGIAALVAIILVIIFIVLGQRAVNADKEALTKLQNDSAQYFDEKGTFVGFCSSGLFQETKKNFTYDITCWNDHTEAGVQITAGLASEYFLCKPATLPPANGKTLKKFTCVQTPGRIYETVR